MSFFTIAINSMASRFITIEIAKNNIGQANVYFSSVFFANVTISTIVFIPFSVMILFLDSFTTFF